MFRCIVIDVPELVIDVPELVIDVPEIRINHLPLSCRFLQMLIFNFRGTPRLSGAGSP
jgi:hypothetical protein